jgi:small GTP-binding protein
MESSNTSLQLSQDEQELIQKYFKDADRNQDGVLDYSEFSAWLFDSFGCTDEECRQGYDELSSSTAEATLEGAYKYFTKIKNDMKDFLTIFEKCKSTCSILPPIAKGSHEIGAFIGPNESIRTQFNLNVNLNSDAAEKYEELFRGHSYENTPLALRITFEANSPDVARVNLESIVKMTLTLAKNFLATPKSPLQVFLQNLKFEYLTEGSSVTLVMTSTQKGLEFLGAYFRIMWKQYNLSNIKATLNFKAFSDLSFDLFTNDDPSERNLTKLIEKLGTVNLSLKTNADPLLKRLLRPEDNNDKTNPMKPWWLMCFLQDESLLNIKVKNVDIASFLPVEPGLPVIDAFEDTFFTPIFKMIKKMTEAYKDVPLVSKITDLFENYLKADVQIALYVPNTLATVQFKTSGVNDLFQKIKLIENENENNNPIDFKDFFKNFQLSLFPKKELRTLMLGLDAVGKTSMLYKLKLGEVVTCVPTIGFNVEEVAYKKKKFIFWDVGGGDKIRLLWRHYYEGTAAILYIVDSTDKERMYQNKELIHKFSDDTQLKGAVIVVVANKQDMPNALTLAQITEKMNLHNLRNIPWCIKPTCAITGDGLYECLDWICENAAKPKK